MHISHSGPKGQVTYLLAVAVLFIVVTIEFLRIKEWLAAWVSFLPSFAVVWLIAYGLRPELGAGRLGRAVKIGWWVAVAITTLVVIVWRSRW